MDHQHVHISNLNISQNDTFGRTFGKKMFAFVFKIKLFFQDGGIKFKFERILNGFESLPSQVTANNCFGIYRLAGVNTCTIG